MRNEKELLALILLSGSHPLFSLSVLLSSSHSLFSLPVLISHSHSLYIESPAFPFSNANPFITILPLLCRTMENNQRFDFQRLTVYQKASEFNRQCSKLIAEKRAPNYVKDQLGRAGISILLNLAEGSGRKSPQDRSRFFMISRSSLFECVALLDLMHQQHQVEETEYLAMTQTADEISRMLFTMIKNLRKS